MVLKNILAGTAIVAALTVPAMAMAQPTQFDIPAQNISAAISAFGRQSGLQVVAPADFPALVKSRPVKGEVDARSALGKLIDGTGLEIASDKDGVIVLRLDAAASDIIVTAQRRREQLQDVPVAVTALSSADIRNQRLLTIQDVARVTPGLTMAAFSYQAPNISMRGANNSFSQVGVDRPVAIVLDDVFISRPSAAVFNLYDLESVQVLRGPQGTLFGRNVTGGAIVLTTQKPSFDKPSYRASIGYGNYDQVEANALVNLPVSDNVGIKIVGSHLSHDGYGFDRISNREQDDLESNNIRAQLRARSGNIDTLFSVDYSRDRNNGKTLASFGLGATGNPRISVLGVDQFFKRRMGGISNTTNWEIPGDAGTLTAITAYRKLRSRELFSTAGASYLFLTAGSQGVNDDTANVQDFSEEVRYTSPKWQWGDFVAGVYYLHNNAKQNLFVTSYTARTGVVSGRTAAYQKATTNSISGYVDGNINLPANFRLTLGGRFTYDDKTASVNYVNSLNARASFDTGELSRNFSQFTPRVVLSWRPLEDHMLYASFSKGYTSGGFATTNTTLVAVSQGFQPEKVTNYEAGIKSSFFDRRITANLSLFDMKFKNKQEFVFNSLTGIGNITNAAEAKSKGLELELGLHPIRGLDVTGTYAALRSRYDSFVVPGLLNYTGNPLAYSPRNKASVTVNYERPVADLAIVSANFSYVWTDTYSISASTTQLGVPSFPLSNASLAFETPDRHYRLQLWIKNLSNKDYELNATTTGTLSKWFGSPRTYGATASVQF